MLYEIPRITSLAILLLLSGRAALSQQSGASAPPVPIHLQVDSGVSLKLYITHRVWFRRGEPVEAKVIEPVWAFDRIVIPAQTTAHGTVVALRPVSKMQRLHAILNGDFTPLKRAEVAFSSLTFPDGRTLGLQTVQSAGLGGIYIPPRPSKKAKKHKGASANQSRLRQFVQQQAQAQLQLQANARSYGFYSFVRGPNKRQWLENFLLSKLPYHPQWYLSNTRFDALLFRPLDFGIVQVANSEFAKPGTRIPADSIGQMTMLQTISSSTARVGDSMEAELRQPLFTPQHKLLLPQGTHLSGRITLAQPARMLHRVGRLRFSIERVDVPAMETAVNNGGQVTQKPQRVEAQLAAAEAGPSVIKVDAEGTATATESKTRLLRPAIATLVAMKSLDNDTGKAAASGSGGAAGVNAPGRALGGFSGFGLLGTVAARGPSAIGAGLGFYGLAWSVYSNLISRGSDVTFEKNTAVAIKFGNAPR